MAVATLSLSRWLAGYWMRSSRLTQTEATITRRHRAKGKGKPRPKRTPNTAADCPATASQRRRTRVSRRRCRAWCVRFFDSILDIIEQNRAAPLFAKQRALAYFPIHDLRQDLKAPCNALEPKYGAGFRS